MGPGPGCNCTVSDGGREMRSVCQLDVVSQFWAYSPQSWLLSGGWLLKYIEILGERVSVCL